MPIEDIDHLIQNVQDILTIGKAKELWEEKLLFVDKTKVLPDYLAVALMDNLYFAQEAPLLTWSEEIYKNSIPINLEVVRPYTRVSPKGKRLGDHFRDWPVLEQAISLLIIIRNREEENLRYKFNCSKVCEL